MCCWYRGSLATLAALRGRDGEARKVADEVLVEASERNLVAARVLAHRALGLLALAAGRTDEALEHFLPRDDAAGSVHPGIALQNVPELVEAAAQVNQHDRTADPLSRFSRWAEATKAPELLALAARCRALVGSGDIEHEFRRALALRARADARIHLRAALETFQRLGVSVWAGRAHDKLRATGSPAPDEPALLTPQESRIATAVGEGATNREIAAQLFLSPRTVDYHLQKVFQKLGISSRADLIRLATSDRDRSDRISR